MRFRAIILHTTEPMPPQCFASDQQLIEQWVADQFTAKGKHWGRRAVGYIYRTDETLINTLPNSDSEPSQRP